MLTLLIIRHAEKPADDPDSGNWPGPGLTEQGEQDKDSLVIRGWQRAGAWAALFGAGLIAGSAGAYYPEPAKIYAATPGDRPNHGPSRRPATKNSDARVAFCYPWKSFVSLKLTPDASQTLNGFTFGISHGLHQYLDLMIGVAYSAHNEISPGFQQAAVNVVREQQAAKNPYYAEFNLAALAANNTQTAYDGFPTQLLNANGTTGPLIYNGSVTISHYRPGLFLGVSLPLSFKSAVSGQ